MGLTFRWVGEEEFDRVAEARTLCYSSAMRDLEQHKLKLRADKRAKPGDFLLAELDGTAVGTSTSISMNMWIRGGAVPFQGVAYVGTIKTHRRGGGREKGIGSQIMFETLRLARQRQQVVSALMPFRASFYEHFGYGLAEKRTEWTVPLSILPPGDFQSIRFSRPQDYPAIVPCHQRQVQRGQCDVERSAEGWELYRQSAQSKLEVVDAAGETVRGYMLFGEVKQDNKTFVRIAERAADNHAAFVRQLSFLASLKDQYSAAILYLPSDYPLLGLLRERQIPHRPVEHASAKAHPFTRMQIRVLDHMRLLEAMKLPEHVAGAAVVAVHECEGYVSKFRIDLSNGHAVVTPSHATADIQCADKIWASLASGDLSASDAARTGLIEVNNLSAVAILDALSIGPSPFSNEYF